MCNNQHLENKRYLMKHLFCAAAVVGNCVCVCGTWFPTLIEMASQLPLYSHDPLTPLLMSILISISSQLV